MAAIDDDVLHWATNRPVWQRNLLKRLARGEEIGDEHIDEMAEAIVSGEVGLESPALDASDLRSGDPGEVTVRLASIGGVKNVNALVGDQTLTFGATGITVIYGDNASGKSGYARIMKDLVGARHSEVVLPNAYQQSEGEQAAVLACFVDGQESSLAWPNGDGSSLRQAHFYDEACGDHYLEHDTELQYRPSVLRLLDQLVALTDEVRVAVGGILDGVESRRFLVPTVPAGTTAETLLEGLSARTTKKDFDAGLNLAPDAEDVLTALRAEEARLQATDPAKEKARLTAGSAVLTSLADHVDAIRDLVSVSEAEKLVKLRDEATRLRKAADDVSSDSFAEEPLSGVGTATWRLLWEAAERFSLDYAYPDVEFPATGQEHRCVLCQQLLSSDGGGERLRSFHAFVQNDVAKRASGTEREYAGALRSVANLTVSTAPTEAAVKFLEQEDDGRSITIDLALTRAEEAKTRLLERLRGESAEDFLELVVVDTAGLRELAVAVEARATEIDDEAFKTSLKEARVSREELEGRIVLSKCRDDLEAEILRMKEEARIRKIHSGISTRAATNLATALAAKYVTDAVKARFVAEAQQLRLEHLSLGDRPGLKAKVRHRPRLVGADGLAPREVLSEGEQTAAGLAGFFTELQFDSSKSAVVFDDPVTSLDHERRDRAARRIIEAAADRQVIVFTHDLVFLGALLKAAEIYQIVVTERSIRRTNSGTPGLVEDGHPWKAKDAPKRIGDLRTSLAKLRKQQDAMSPDEYEVSVATWAGELSETWERIVRSEIAYKVVDRSTTEVKPRLFRVFTKISAGDQEDFENGYKAATTWAKRHDKSEEVNSTPPVVDEMESELKRINDFYKRIKKYSD